MALGDCMLSFIMEITIKGNKKMKEILELSDLIDNEDLIKKYFVTDEIEKIYSQPLLNMTYAQACWLKNLNEHCQPLPLNDLNIYRDYENLVGQMWKLFPIGIIIPTIHRKGQKRSKARDHLITVTYECTVEPSIPLKKKDEIYLIFPFVVIIESLTSKQKQRRLKPVWGIQVIKNYLLDDKNFVPIKQEEIPGVVIERVCR